MTDSPARLFAETLSAPLGEIIASVGRGVAEAQIALDAASIEATLALYHGDRDALLRDIGYQPTFYVLPETTCQVQVSMTIGETSGATPPPPPAAGKLAQIAVQRRPLLRQALPKSRSYVTPVNAGFQQRYGYEAKGATTLTFKIVPVPPPSAMEAEALRGLRSVPDVTGLAAEPAIDYLSRAGFESRLIDQHGQPVAAASASVAVQAQDIPAGSLREAGSVVTLTFGS